MIAISPFIRRFSIDPQASGCDCREDMNAWTLPASRFCRSLIAAALGFLMIPSGTSAAAPAYEPLRIAFWNIEWFPGKRPEPTAWEEKDHTPLVQAAIKEINPDILGMVEIRNEEAAKLAVSVIDGMTVNVCSQFLRDDGSVGMQQLAIASRLNPVSAWAEAWVPRSGLKLPRGFSFAAYPVGQDTVVLVYVVHFKSNRGEIQQNIPAREASTKQLLAHVKEMQEIYQSAYAHVTTVLAGDFNTSLDDERFRREHSLRNIKKAGFTWAWEKTPVSQRITLPSQPQMDPSREPFPPASFDHIFIQGANIVKMEAPETSPLASDHRPVVIDLLIPVRHTPAPTAPVESPTGPSY
jgi:endonuclease/exonuclease/phosphatase family metal-dependent hydrolase